MKRLLVVLAALSYLWLWVLTLVGTAQTFEGLSQWEMEREAREWSESHWPTLTESELRAKYGNEQVESER